MIDKDVKEYILQELHNLEKEFHIRILSAVESGSRAWGFSNKYSDYDVRFIYIQPLSEYLTLTPKRDVIDYNDLKHKNYDYPLDFSGWDIKKALYLHYKNNPNLREHLKSNIIYYGDNNYFKELPSYNPISLKYHYSSMTKKIWEKYVKKAQTDDFSPRVVKRYCYCIRQILSWILIDQQNNINCPIHIDDIMNEVQKDTYLSDTLFEDMYTIINYYRDGCKTNKLNEKCILNVSSWINHYLDFMKTSEMDSVEKIPKKDMGIYNKRFREIIQCYGDF
jgi:hypothetical protein